MQGSKQPRFNIGRKSLQQQNDKIWSHWPISVSLNQKIECLLRKMCSWRGLEFLVPIFLSFFCNGNSTDVLFNLLLAFLPCKSWTKLLLLLSGLWSATPLFVLHGMEFFHMLVFSRSPDEWRTMSFSQPLR